MKHNLQKFINDIREIVRKYRFIQANTLTSEQEEYLKSILDYVCQNGDIDKKQLIKSPFTEFDPIQIFGGKFPKVAEFVTHIHESISVA